MRSSLSAVISSLSLVTLSAILAGCSSNFGALPGTSSPETPVGLIKGKVFGGQQPVLGSLVSVVEVGTTGYGSPSTVLATTTSSVVDGSFDFPAGSYTCPFANTPVYLLAQGGDTGAGNNTSLALAAGLGSCSSAQSQQVNINEVTTVATAFALGQFFTTTLGATDDFGANAPSTGTYSPGLVMANTYTIPTLVNIPYGTVNPSTSAVNIEAAKIYSIANTLAACVNSSGTTGASDPCGILFTNTTPPGATTAPTDTLQAAVQISLYPYQNVSTLFELASATAPFVGLSATPNDFTVGVSYTTTALGLSISGTKKESSSSSIDIDASGNVWVPSNLPSAIGLAYFDPTSNTFNGAFSDGNLVHPQYVAIDLDGEAWVSDVSGNFFEVINTTTTGVDYSFDYTETATTSGPVTIDADNTVYLSDIYERVPYLTYVVDYFATGEGGVTSGQAFDEPPTGLVPLYEGGYPDYAIIASSSGTSTVCYLEASETDDEYGAFAETTSDCESGGVAITADESDAVSAATTLNQICSAVDETCFAPSVPVDLPEGIATDGVGAIWVANSGNGSISTMNDDYSVSSPVAYLHNSTNGNTMTAPYGLAIDNSGNVWVSNAGCVATAKKGCKTTSFTLSELIGAAAPTITPLSAQMAGQLQGTEPEVAKRSSPGTGLKNAKFLNKQMPASNPEHPGITRVH